MTNIATDPRHAGSDAKRARRPVPPGAHGIRRIISCVDRSPASEICIPHSISLARVFSCPVTLLHVVEPAQSSGLGGTDALGWELARQEAHAYLERLQLQTSLASGQRVEILLEQGKPAERITAMVRECGADLTVLASHGVGEATAWGLGSTAEQVLALTPSSVYLARSEASPPVRVRRILVLLDGSLRAEVVLPVAARIASANRAEVLLAHVVAESGSGGVLRAPDDLVLARELASRVETGARLYLASVRDRLTREVPAVRTIVTRSSDERQSALDLARTERVDLIVMAAHGLTCNPARSLGTFAHHIATHSSVPLLLLQDVPGRDTVGVPDDHGAPPLRGSFAPEEA